MTSKDNDVKLVHCPALVTIRVISGKWKTRILWLLRSESMMFGQLKRNLKGISAKMLTEHLRQLEKDGVIANITEDKGNQTSSRYEFTSYGRTLIPVLDSIGNWGLIHEDKT